MADDDKNAPILGELLGGGLGGEAPGRGSAMTEQESLCAPLHRLHERRIVRDAGRMVVGFRMPTPYSLGDEMEPVGLETPVFSSNVKKPGRSGVSRIAIAVACAVAFGSTAMMTGVIGPQEPAAGSLSVASGPEKVALADDPELSGHVRDRQMNVASTASIQDTHTVSLMAVSPASVAHTRVASLSPTVIESPKKAAPGGFVRVAQKDAPTLGVSNVFGPAGKPVRLPISLNGARAEDYSFLMFRGLPANVTLSAGFRLKESWAVSLRDLDNLMIEAPESYQGNFNLEILLIKGRDTPAESQVISVEIVAQDIQLPPSPAFAQPAPGPQVLTAAPRTVDPAERAPVAPVIRPAARAAAPAPAPAPAAMSPQEEAMMTRAASLLANNDVSSARLVYEHLANSGSARAALAMGQTYDPAYLRAIDPKGLKSDVAKARQWYKRAAELGDQDAASRLSGLASR
jgi:hypothetical protein